MMKMKKKTRYVSPQLTGTSALLLSLICQSLRFNVQVKELENMNDVEGTEEVFYFDS